LWGAALISAPGAVTLPVSAVSALGVKNVPGATRRGGTGMADEELTTDELLVEEVSIDGMCGVY
jgi:mycofactocin precursor